MRAALLRGSGCAQATAGPRSSRCSTAPAASSICWAALQTGAAYVGVPSFDPEVMFRVIQAERCTHLSGVPTSYLAMLDHPARRNYDLSSLRGGTCGGADCNPDVLRRCAEDFPMPGLCQVYGQTEGSTLFTCPSTDDPLRWETAGTALPGYELRIVDPATLQPLPAGQIGEIAGARADGDAGLLQETGRDGGDHHRGRLAAQRRSRFLHATTGHLVIAGGRLRDMIIRGGENIYPAEIENLLQAHPAVAGSRSSALRMTYYGEIVAAAVKLSAPVAAAALQAHCAARIAKFKVPAVIYAVESFPLTPSGKIRKVELRQWAAEQRMERLA